MVGDDQVYVHNGQLYEARLALVDIAANIDKFLELKILSRQSKFEFVVTGGRTGTKGTSTHTFSFDAKAAVEAFEVQFEACTGIKFSERNSDLPTAEGKYAFVKQNRERERAQKDMRWKYYMDNGVDGKADGWYVYTKEASDVVERVYQEWQDNPQRGLAIRSVQSGHFAYRIDFNTMQQENTSTGTKRTIVRS